MKAKTPSESLSITTEIVLPNDTNNLDNLMGGRLLHWMDIVAAIACQKHSNSIVVTASVDGVSFKKAIQLGDVVTLKAQVTRAFNSSMEVFIEVFAQNIPKGEQFKCNDAYYTFVAIDADNKPVKVPALEPQTEEDKKYYDGALRRRQVRLVLAGKLKPKDAHELRDYLVDQNIRNQ